jgi:5-methyltetrahydropteroyltriglutamate--homocysteine methyltransferase
VSSPPFRAEHIGSFLRPEALLRGTQRADEAIAEVIRWQESLGLRVVTDGEFRRESWRLGFVSKVAGFARGDDPEKLIDLYIDLINRVLRGRPADLTVGVHMCRGNAMGKWIGAGGYERIAEKAFSRLEVDAFFLEYDSERAGGFEPLRFMPKGKRVVLGLVSTKIPELEEASLLKKKIEAATRYVPLENLSISPQCGFASHQKGSGLSFAQQEAKLRLVVRTATEVWGSA